MAEACPIPTDAQRRFGEALRRTENTMVQTVFAAPSEAYEAMATSSETAELGEGLPAQDYYLAVILQKVFCTLCHADPQTMAGGNPAVATAVVRNFANIARHHWGADFEPHRIPDQK